MRFVMREKIVSKFILITALIIFSGCHHDVVTTRHLDQLAFKCAYVEPISTPTPQMGEVLRDVLIKELVRKEIAICGANTATMTISGSAFMTNLSKSNQNFLGGSSQATEAIESVSLVVEDRDGKILATASYDNRDRKSAGRIGKELGSAIASKLKQ
jgi:hypothetical protein